MKTIKVRVSVGATVNLGNFESLKIAYDLEAELADEESPGDTVDILRHALTDKIRKDLKESDGGKKYLTMKAYVEEVPDEDFGDHDDIQ